jgi:cyclase
MPLLPCAFLALTALIPLNTWSLPAQQQGEVQIESIRVADGLYMLTGQGGNIGLSIGDDGALLIDDQFAPLTEKILAAVTELTDEPVRYVLNTHWHFDHTGGNENLAGVGAVLVAHENVRKRLSTKQYMEAFDRTVEPSPDSALPSVTFVDGLTLHWNDGEIHAFHVERAHTDGDAIVHFRSANAFHMGDTYFHGFYPFIDVSSGGRLEGVIAAADQVLALCDEDTMIIPGHGPLSDVTDLRAYRAMLELVRGRVQTLIDDGRSREDVVNARPTKDLDDAWGGGFMEPDRWVGIVYDSMTR